VNSHDDLGFDADLGPGRDVLKQTIGALVDGATPRGVPSAPEQNLGVLRRKVRTWRIAKAGAIGLTTSVVIGALTFSAAQASTWTRSEPLPGRPTIHSSEMGPVPSEIPTTRMSPNPATASPTPSASPSSTPRVEPTPDVGASSVVTDPEPGGSEAPEVAWPPFEPFDEGYLPWNFDAAPIGCGLPIDDLPVDPVRFTIGANDSPADLKVTSGFTITEIAGESYELAYGIVGEYLLFQHGRLVGSSLGFRTDAGYWGQNVEEREGEDGYPDVFETTSPGQVWQVEDASTLGIDENSTCGERAVDPAVPPFPEFFTPLPAGEYEVVYVAMYKLLEEDSSEFVFTDPYPITIP
jgi:hypothetical protein